MPARNAEHVRYVDQGYSGSPRYGLKARGRRHYALWLAKLFDAHVTATAIKFELAPPPSMLDDYPIEALAAGNAELDKLIAAAYRNSPTPQPTRASACSFT